MQSDKPEDDTSMVKLQVSRGFVEELKHGCKELPLPSQAKGYGNKDKIVNAFVFGDQVEAFEYHFAGSHSSKSGFTCAIEAHDLHELKKAQGKSKVSVGRVASILCNSTVYYYVH